MKAQEPSKFWWLRRPKYIALFLRELSSVFILAYVLLYLRILSQRGSRPQLFSQLGTPLLVILGLSILGFSLYHSVTWFMLLPKIQPLKFGGVTLRGTGALVVNIALLALASLIIAFLVFGLPFPFGG